MLQRCERAVREAEKIGLFVSHCPAMYCEIACSYQNWDIGQDNAELDIPTWSGYQTRKQKVEWLLCPTRLARRQRL